MTPHFTICIGCGARATRGNRCDACVVTRPRSRKSRHYEKPPELRRVYASAAWQRARRVVLERDAHTCVLCGMPGTYVDHDPPLRVQLANGGSGVDPSMLRTLCASCNGRVDGPRAKGGRATRLRPRSAPSGARTSDGNSPEGRGGAAARARRERLEQGLPPTLRDSATLVELRRIAAMRSTSR